MGSDFYNIVIALVLVKEILGARAIIENCGLISHFNIYCDKFATKVGYSGYIIMYFNNVSSG